MRAAAQLFQASECPVLHCPAWHLGLICIMIVQACTVLVASTLSVQKRDTVPRCRHDALPWAIHGPQCSSARLVR
jgi:hypothetical protein